MNVHNLLSVFYKFGSNVPSTLLITAGSGIVYGEQIQKLNVVKKRD